ncbi:site-2 protease family protein [Pelagibius sp.]|uniref:site-2 protease family protein n=1 Tax=Pelagibius sp. TaxID=1931238 RepID=UPI002616D3C7|nr:site-2 protease family protein [Pelagibius sp.]
MFGNSPTLTLGRLNGIPVRLDATFLFVPLFFLSMVSINRLDEGWPVVLVGTAGIFFSILAHELGHAFAAKHYQVGVREIVVGGFFGYAHLKRQAVPRKMVIRILAAGPFANLAIFFALWTTAALWSSQGSGLGGAAPPFGVPVPSMVETARTLAYINLAMFVFNMVPAFPLDGGKILGLLLNRVISERKSLQIVSVLSIAAGTLMVLLGFGLSLFLSFIGVLVVATNLRRLRRRPASQQRS